MKFMVCQPDTHNGFVSLINGILVYFTTILPTYSTLDDYNNWMEHQENSNNLTRQRKSSIKDENRIPKSKKHFNYQITSVSNTCDNNTNRRSEHVKSEHEIKESVRESSSSFNYAEYIQDDNTSSNEIRLKMQAAVTLPAAFNYANYHQYENYSDKKSNNYGNETNLCFSVANYSLFHCHLAMIGAPCGYLALVDLCSKRLLYIPPHDPATVHARKSKIEKQDLEQRFFHTENDDGNREESNYNEFNQAAIHYNNNEKVERNAAPSTITWVRNQPLVFVGYSDSTIEWYKISLNENNSNNSNNNKQGKIRHTVAFKETTIVASSLEQYLSNKPAFALESVNTLSCAVNDPNLHNDKNNIRESQINTNTINTYTFREMQSHMISVDYTVNDCNNEMVKDTTQQANLLVLKHAHEMSDVTVQCIVSFTLLPSHEPLMSSDYFPATGQVVVVALCGDVFLFNTEKLTEPVCSFVVDGFRANFVYCHPFLPFIGTLSYNNNKKNTTYDKTNKNKNRLFNDGCELCILKYYTNKSISGATPMSIKDTQALQTVAQEQKGSLLKLFSCHVDNENSNNSLHSREQQVDNSCLDRNLYSFSWKFSQSLELAICGFINVTRHASQHGDSSMLTNNYINNKKYNLNDRSYVNTKEENINESMMNDVFTSHYLHDVQIMRFDYVPAPSVVDNLTGISTHVHIMQQSDSKVFNTFNKQDEIHLVDTFRLPIGVYSLLNVEYISAATECLANVEEHTCNESKNSDTEMYNSKDFTQPINRKQIKSTFFKEHPMTLFSSHNDTLQLFRNYNEQKKLSMSFGSRQESTYSCYQEEEELEFNKYDKNTKQRHKKHSKSITVTSSPSSHGLKAVIPLKEDMLAAMFMKENRLSHHHHHHNRNHHRNNSQQEQEHQRKNGKSRSTIHSELNQQQQQHDYSFHHHFNDYDKRKGNSNYSLSSKQPILMPATQSMARRKARMNSYPKVHKESKTSEIEKEKLNRHVQYAQDMEVVQSSTPTLRRHSHIFTRMQQTNRDKSLNDNVESTNNYNNEKNFIESKERTLQKYKERKSASFMRSPSNRYKEKNNVTKEVPRETPLMHNDAVHNKLCIGSGKFTELFVMSANGKMNSSLIENLYHGNCVAWHEEGSVIVSMGNTVCAAEILPLQGIECAMKRRAEAGFGLHANKCIEALNTVRERAAARGYSLEFIYSSTCDEIGDDFMMMFRYINILQEEHVIGATGDIPSIMELINRTRITEISNTHNKKILKRGTIDKSNNVYKGRTIIERQNSKQTDDNTIYNTSTHKTMSNKCLEVDYVIKLLLAVLSWNTESGVLKESNVEEPFLEQKQQLNSTDSNKKGSYSNYSQPSPSPTPSPTLPHTTSHAALKIIVSKNDKNNINAIEQTIAKCVLVQRSHEAIAMLEQFSHLNASYILLSTLLSSSLGNNSNENMLYLLEQNYETIKFTFMEAVTRSPWLDTVVAYLSLSAYYAKCASMQEYEEQESNKTQNKESFNYQHQEREKHDKDNEYDDDRIKNSRNKKNEKDSSNSYLEQKATTATTTATGTATTEDLLYNLYTTKRKKVLSSNQLTTWDKLAIMLCLHQLRLRHGVNECEELLHDIHVYLLSSLFVPDHSEQNGINFDIYNINDTNKSAIPMSEYDSTCTGSVIRPLQWLLIKTGVHLHAMEFVQEEIVNATGDSQLAACLFARVGVCHTIRRTKSSSKYKHNHYNKVNSPMKYNYCKEVECNGPQARNTLSSVPSSLIQKPGLEYVNVNNKEWKMNMEFVRQTKLPTLSTRSESNTVNMNNNYCNDEADNINCETEEEEYEEDGSLVQLWQSWVHAYRAFLNKEQLFVARTTFDRALQQLEQEHLQFDKQCHYIRELEETGQKRNDAKNVQVQNVHRFPRETDVYDTNDDDDDNMNEKNLFSVSNLHNLHPPAGMIWGILAPFSPFYHLSTSLEPMLIHQRCVICNERVERGIRSPLHNVLLSSSSSHSLDNCYAHCSRCLHGGHVIHLKNWFRVHRECAVLGCPCHCNEDVNLC